MPSFIANADYEERDTSPIWLKPGETVRVYHRDHAWPGWVWAENEAGDDGYVPEDYLESETSERYRATKAFDPTVLTIRHGDALESLLQIHGWHWCRKSASGEEGWVAGYLLRPLA